MTEKTLSKKKVYQVAKEINISHETLMEYLTKRGHVVKSHMSVLDDAMMHDILSHFKKDKEVAEKHQRKIQTIRESRTRKLEAKAAQVVEEAARAKVTKKLKAEEEPVAVAEMPVLEKKAVAVVEEAPEEEIA